MLSNTQRVFGPLTALMLCLVGTVSAAVADISNVVLRVQATNATGSGSFQAYLSQMTYNPGNQTWTWSLPTPVVIFDDVTFDPVATLNSATLTLRDNPALSSLVLMGFGVTAGTTETTFIIDSALVSFPTIPEPVAMGRASAGFSVTDVNGDGARIMGLGPPGTGMYTAQYNGFVPSGSTFSNLVAQVLAGPGGSGSGSQNDPPAGDRPMGAAVYDMSARAAFTLTAFDLGSATTLYRIVPEPATASLALLAALVGVRRR